MARFCPLCSSSEGNSIYIGTTSEGILIDAGTNCKQLTAMLSQVGIAPESIKAIFITHEHTDHIGALRVFASKYHTRVFASQGTLMGLELNGHTVGSFDCDIIDEKGISLDSMEVTAFHTSHDSRESLGFAVDTGDRRLAVATDTGILTKETIEGVTGCDLVLIESNHDLKMLENGPYPYDLKRRIKSELGHLSNADCAAFLPSLLQSGTTRFILGHLSRENNLPEIAYNAALAALCGTGAQEGKDFLLTVARPRTTASGYLSF